MNQKQLYEALCKDHSKINLRFVAKRVVEAEAERDELFAVMRQIVTSLEQNTHYGDQMALDLAREALLKE